MTNQESFGFRFLEHAGAVGVICFKLLEIAHAEHPVFESTSDQSEAEQKLLDKMLGRSVAAGALRAYVDCKERTSRFIGMNWADPRIAAYIGGFVRLYNAIIEAENPTPEETGRILMILVRDLGEYYGILVDDEEGTKDDHIKNHVSTLILFQQAEPKEANVDLQLKRNTMTKDLVDYEIARTILPTWSGVKARSVHGDNGTIDKEVTLPVSYESFHLKLRFSDEIRTPEDRDALRKILPHFLLHRFTWFTSLEQTKRFIKERAKQLLAEEQESFAILKMLQHFNGRIPDSMPAFAIEDVRAAAKIGYKALQHRMKSSGRAFNLRGKLSDAFEFLSNPIRFSWDASEEYKVRLWGNYEDLVFVPEHVLVKLNKDKEEHFRFICFHSKEASNEHVFVTKYQTTINEELYDTFLAAQNNFAKAPRTFTITLSIEPVVRYAFGVIHSDEEEAATDVEEYALLRSFCAITGGVKSSTLHVFMLADASARKIYDYPVINNYVSALYNK